MTVNVTLDQGNSSTKMVVFDRESGKELTCAVLRQPGDINGLLADYDVAAVIGCSVADGRDLSHLMREIGVASKMVLGPETPVPLRNLYASPETLGADRLAAAVGAAAILPGENLLVADIGTACTFDVVTAADEYLGGNISPGPGMRLRALNHYTARLPLVSGHADFIPGIGQNTVEALRCGAMRGVVAELLYYSDWGKSRRIVLSGGWAPEIAALLPDSVACTIEPHLVNQGLNTILQYNQA
ncbi:MAG: type III pantothenate kinase [Bacteroides sp.]|nr:type III pantothenate kinase [Bacteroides sp.]MCM1378869.1 type III pantothenate kinase [Bacteroides sp.]MCM1445485.1 type III pantothenate kinase [Prevotella sp.]